MRPTIVLIVLGTFAACTGNPDSSPNVLPDWEKSADVAVPDVSASCGASLDSLPAQYRFTTITIEQLGSDGPTGFLTLFLQFQWTADIDDYKWNQVFAIAPGEAGTQEVSVQVLSAVGTMDGDLCSLQPAESEKYVTPFGNGCLSYEFPRLNIYTEDNEGTAFNCSTDPDVGDMIPIQGVSGTLSVSPDGESVTGEFIGCLTEAHTLSLCSCIGDCVPGDAHPGCPGCPEGSAPLKESLGNLVTTETCTELLGEPAFDLRAAFVATRLQTEAGVCE